MMGVESIKFQKVLISILILEEIIGRCTLIMIP